MTVRISSFEYDGLTGRIEQKFHTVNAWTISADNRVDLIDVRTLEQGILLSMNGLAQIQPFTRWTIPTWTRSGIGAVSPTRWRTIVSCG